jgi:hypothetical protein
MTDITSYLPAWLIAAAVPAGAVWPAPDEPAKISKKVGQIHHLPASLGSHWLFFSE